MKKQIIHISCQKFTDYNSEWLILYTADYDGTITMNILFLGLLCVTRANQAEIYSKKHAIDGVFLLSIQVFRGVNNYCATSEK